ncbi:hypothetical protein K493DRAFT_320816 [Basidiobolus meristosporus CBS 931.73]|uniref:Uncharacterized protein n=1 Tax=Basidiobolus meristosporus CBS 931.73 TaxID=1314790 RepID=A0A1Y1X581_9FUNG|nr:hypothetical protein K493DRAFT_320816 [Basidiobolus meristosporus CBS 931.73]|eukprot:ORX80808.1 hypothetical protein K493DRAFT_320816 [Basidiobolus meristosporus CBS 931.73]
MSILEQMNIFQSPLSPLTPTEVIKITSTVQKHIFQKPLSPDDYNLFVTEGKINLAVNCQSQYDVEKALRSKSDVIHLHPACQALHRQIEFLSAWVARLELVKKFSTCVNLLLLYSKPCQNFWSRLTRPVRTHTLAHLREESLRLTCKRLVYVSGVFLLVKTIYSGLKHALFYRFGWWRLGRYIYVKISQDGEDQHFLVSGRLRQTHLGIAPCILRGSYFRSLDVINTINIIAATNYVLGPLEGFDF